MPEFIWPEGFDPTEVGSTVVVSEQEYVAAFCVDGLGHLAVSEEPDRCEKCDTILQRHHREPF